MAHDDAMSITSKSVDSTKDDFAAEQISEVESGRGRGGSTGGASGSQTSDELQSEGDEQRSLWQNVKKYRKVTYITLGLTSAILLYGYDNVVVGTISAMPDFQ